MDLIGTSPRTKRTTDWLLATRVSLVLWRSRVADPASWTSPGVSIYWLMPWQVTGGAFLEDQIKGESRGDRQGERAGSLTPFGLGSPLVNIWSGFWFRWRVAPARKRQFLPNPWGIRKTLAETREKGDQLACVDLPWVSYHCQHGAPHCWRVGIGGDRAQKGAGESVPVWATKMLRSLTHGLWKNSPGTKEQKLESLFKKENTGRGVASDRV